MVTPTHWIPTVEDQTAVRATRRSHQPTRPPRPGLASMAARRPSPPRLPLKSLPQHTLAAPSSSPFTAAVTPGLEARQSTPRSESPPQSTTRPRQFSGCSECDAPGAPKTAHHTPPRRSCLLLHAASECFIGADSFLPLDTRDDLAGPVPKQARREQDHDPGGQPERGRQDVLGDRVTASQPAHPKQGSGAKGGRRGGIFIFASGARLGAIAPTLATRGSRTNRKETRTTATPAPTKRYVGTGRS